MKSHARVLLSVVALAGLATASVAGAQGRSTTSPVPPTPGRPAATPTMGSQATPGAPSSGGSPSASPTTSTGIGGPATVSMPSGTPLPSDYVIGPGDVLQITVWKNETLSRVIPVRPDGKVSMPLLHDIHAAGLTAMQLRDKIATSLGEYLPNPEVSVSVNEVRSLRISVLGEVQRPGVLELRGSTTILEAIAMAGGFRDFASPSKITVIRTDDSGKTERLRFNYNKATHGDEPNLVLRSGDVVVVP